MNPKIFIDGREGTTGLQIYDRLCRRRDITLLEIDESKRKDVNQRKKLINDADIVFLCLPDDAAKESVTLVENEDTKIIDASTAHRTHNSWVYGFPELDEMQRETIMKSKRVSNPGCHSTGIISMVYPLIKMGILPSSYPLTCISLTGYSGGGKSMINAYESKDGAVKTADMYSPRMYGLDLNHKHIPEIMAVTGLSVRPIFCPIVDDYYSGIAASITLFNESLNGNHSTSSIIDALSEHYKGERFIKVNQKPGSGMLESNWGVGTNNLEITVSGSDTQLLITARFDNLGKGASGAAVQNMNLMLGLNEEEGL